jgi:uncharacterized protein (DUF1778 family)
VKRPRKRKRLVPKREEYLRVRVTAGERVAIEEAAKLHRTDVSSYVRRVVFRAVQADGIKIT